MGIVLVLVVVSLVGAASLYLMDSTKVAQERIANDARVQSYQSLVRMVTGQLHSGNTCSELLKDIPLIKTVGSTTYSAFNYQGVPITLDLKLPMNPSPLQAPVGNFVWYIAGGTSIRDVRLFIKEKVRAPVRLEASGSPVWTAATGHILIFPGHPGVGMRLPRNKFYKIPLFVYFSGSGNNRRLVACSGPDNEAYFCTLSGGAYDYEETDPARRCQPDRTCFAYKNPIVNNAGSCPSPYQALPIGHIGGTLYLCNWCNKNSPMAPAEPAEVYYNDPVFPPEWY